MSETTPTPDEPAPVTLRLEQIGRTGELFPIVAINVLLTLVTLTIYRFWAKTRVRAYLWSTTRLLGDRFEYTGRGMELFIGFAIVLAVVIVPLIVIGTAAQFMMEEEQVGPAVGLFMLVYLTGLYLTGVAIYRAQRYRYSRTRWRGIRPALTGSPWLYGLIFIAVLFLNGATMGWAAPWGRLRLMQQMMSNTLFGDRPFVFEGGSGPLYGPFALYWFGRLFTLGFGILFMVLAALGVNEAGFEKASPAEQAAMILIFLVSALAIGILNALLFAFYKAREMAYIATCMRLEGLRFRFEATTWSLTWLVFVNYLILIFTLGLGYPFVQLRNFRYLADRLSAEGSIDFEAIQQSSEALPSYGEGLADAFDVGSV